MKPKSQANYYNKEKGWNVDPSEADFRIVSTINYSVTPHVEVLFEKNDGNGWITEDFSKDATDLRLQGYAWSGRKRVFRGTPYLIVKGVRAMDSEIWGKTGRPTLYNIKGESLSIPEEAGFMFMLRWDQSIEWGKRIKTLGGEIIPWRSNDFFFTSHTKTFQRLIKQSQVDNDWDIYLKAEKLLIQMGSRYKELVLLGGEDISLLEDARSELQKAKNYLDIIKVNLQLLMKKELLEKDPAPDNSWTSKEQDESLSIQDNIGLIALGLQNLGIKTHLDNEGNLIIEESITGNNITLLKSDSILVFDQE